MNKRNLRTLLPLGVGLLLSLAILAPAAAKSIHPVSHHPATGALGASATGHAVVRMPNQGELIPMSAHAVNPWWGAPRPPSPNNPNPMGPLHPGGVNPMLPNGPLAHPTGKEVPLTTGGVASP